eukprot:PhF_6_TR28265/c0_g1_i1/m.41821
MSLAITKPSAITKPRVASKTPQNNIPTRSTLPVRSRTPLEKAPSGPSAKGSTLLLRTHILNSPPRELFQRSSTNFTSPKNSVKPTAPIQPSTTVVATTVNPLVSTTVPTTTTTTATATATTPARTSQKDFRYGRASSYQRSPSANAPGTATKPTATTSTGGNANDTLPSYEQHTNASLQRQRVLNPYLTQDDSTTAVPAASPKGLKHSTAYERSVTAPPAIPRLNIPGVPNAATFTHQQQQQQHKLQSFQQSASYMAAANGTVTVSKPVRQVGMATRIYREFLGAGPHPHVKAQPQAAVKQSLTSMKREMRAKTFSRK